jgi:hypothetical protein
VWLAYIVATGPLTTGRFSANMALVRQDNPAYASGMPVGGL